MRREIGSTDIQARLWSYRGGSEALVLECGDGSSGKARMVFHTVWVMKPGLEDELLVPDMAEAMHLAGLVLAHLDVRPTIGSGPTEPLRGTGTRGS